MSRRRITIETGARTFTVRGWRAGDLASDAGVKVIYSGSASGWLGDLRRLPDLIAYLEHRHIAVEVTDADAPAAVVVSAPAEVHDEAETGGLW